MDSRWLRRVWFVTILGIFLLHGWHLTVWCSSIRKSNVNNNFIGPFSLSLWADNSYSYSVSFLASVFTFAFKTIEFLNTWTISSIWTFDADGVRMMKCFMQVRHNIKCIEILTVILFHQYLWLTLRYFDQLLVFRRVDIWLLLSLVRIWTWLKMFTSWQFVVTYCDKFYFFILILFGAQRAQHMFVGRVICRWMATNVQDLVRLRIFTVFSRSIRITGPQSW